MKTNFKQLQNQIKPNLKNAICTQSYKNTAIAHSSTFTRAWFAR